LSWVIILLAARCVMLWVLPLSDPTEGRYAVVAKEMAVSGDWVTPHLWMDGQSVPFLGKPPLYFWSAAACMRSLASMNSPHGCRV
jgi:4-amino-4-deoxy-L-arabinose transferase-like glycosyltransferase